MYSQIQLRQLCRQYGFTPSKRYGQSFLINTKPLAAMLEAAELTKKDTVLEIGPGFGILTQALSSRAGKVKAFEIEKKLQKYWDEITSRDKSCKNVEIVWGNFLHSPDPWPAGRYKVVANLPYQITSAVIRKFLAADNPPRMMVVMVQREVAERICARPGQMSLLSVAVQFYARPDILMPVPKKYFWPRPQVDSAIVKIDQIDEKRWKISPEDFFHTVRIGFSNKRKLLANNLLPLTGKNRRSGLIKTFKKLGLSEQCRAQQLSVQQWVELAQELIR